MPLQHHAASVETVLAEIREMFGSVPAVFERMREVGDLVDNWPGVRALYVEPGPLPREVVDVLLSALALRCHGDYCMVLHSLGLIDECARLSAAELAEHLAVPDHVPNHERWDRVVRQAWLATAPGPQRRATAHALELACTPEELAWILHVCAIGALLTSYVSRHAMGPCTRSCIETLPEQIRELVPSFVEFHSMLSGVPGVLRPVCTTCASCRQIRSTTDRAWYPREAIAELVPEDVLFSHGLCERCFAQHNWLDE